MKSHYAGGLAISSAKLASLAFYCISALFILFGTTTARGELVAAWGANTYGQTQLPEGLDQVVAVSAGLGHNLALKADGKVVAWGDYPSSLINIPPANLPFVTAIAAGANHSLALTTSGTVIAWGDDTYNQTEVPFGLTNVIAIAAGYSDSVALKADGTVRVWGVTSPGEYPNPYIATNIPPGLSNVVAIACGESHILALTADGFVIVWGRNNEGETNVPPGLSNVVSIGAGATSSFAITADGSVVGWGDNSAGQLDIPPGLSDVVAVTGGEVQSLALQADGTVVVWGVGDGSTNYGQGVVPAGLSDVTAIAAGYWCNLALTFEGPIQIVQEPQSQTSPYGSDVTFSVMATGVQPISYQWFMNGQPLSDGYGISGSATAALSITNVQPSDEGTYDVLASNAFGSVLSSNALLNLIPPPQVVVQPTNESALIFGSAAFSVTVRSSLPVSYQWVFNGEPIANETNADLILSPLNCAQSGYYNVIVSNASGAVSSSKAQLTVTQAVVSTSGSADLQDFLLQFCNVVAVSAGSGTVYALKADGTVAGYVPYVSPESEVPPGLSDVVAISGGEGDILALRSDGTVAAWGFGGSILTNVPDGVTDVYAVAAGGGDNFALRSNGTVVAWGESPPQFLSSLSNVVAIAAGDGQFLALNANGTVVEGFSQGGQPELVPGLSNVIAIAMADYNAASLALKADGTVLAWGGIATNPLPNVSNVVAIAAGSDVLALKSDGAVASSTPSLSFPFALSNVFGIAIVDGYVGAALLNDGSPVFTVQPGNQNWTNGSTIWLHARAVGVQPMSYQWQFNGINILDATNADLTITNAQGSDSGQYCALASNSVGSATSRLASVTIQPGPPITVSHTLAQALNATNLAWSTSGSAAWFPETANTHDRIAAAQSGAISNSMSSGLETTVIGPGTLTFWWSVSSEEFFDFLSFYIDSGTNYAARISGEVAWEQEAFPIASGSHTLRWIYSKDPDISVGEDAGWLDQVSFVATLLPAQLGAPTLLPDGRLLFNVFTTNGNSLTLTDPASVTFEASSNLVDWITLTNAVTLTNGGALLSDPTATNSAVRFYRLQGP
jgi:alpha-tubulin suppressor-like RCC1 family protein